LALTLGGCTPENWGPEALSRGSGDISDETRTLGKEGYEKYCLGCHGVNGDGQGPASIHLSPKPRDFRVGKLKFASVASGDSPHDDDYLNIITRGLQGTAMPTFRFVPLEERKAIVVYIKEFVTKAKAPGERVHIPKDPFVKRPAKGVKQGERMYHGLAACSSCHPAYADKKEIYEHITSYDMPFSGFRAKMYQSVTKDSDWGEPITPPDFFVDRIKTGASKEDIVKVIAAGVGGTAMPNWAATLKPKQLWSLAYYVESIAKLRGSREASARKAALASQPEFKAPAPPPKPEPPPSDEGGAEGDKKDTQDAKKAPTKAEPSKATPSPAAPPAGATDSPKSTGEQKP
jgi:mono/diheme cytochrome c family protein